jgi:hypothetical protein
MRLLHFLDRNLLDSICGFELFSADLDSLVGKYYNIGNSTARCLEIYFRCKTGYV